MKEYLKGLLLGMVILFSVSIMYQITKDISYSYFYKDMVKETINEMVKPDCLNK